MNLKEIYDYKVIFPHTLNEHLPTFKSLTEECEHVTEMGVRDVNGTFGFLMGHPKKMISIDLFHPKTFGAQSSLDDAIRVSQEEGIDYSFIEADSLKVEIEQTDLLFLDTFHSYFHLIGELRKHSSKVNKYILMHDTVSFGTHNQNWFEAADERNDDINKLMSGKQGLVAAYQEFLEENNEWELFKHYENNNGLTILKRK